jgi:hypothetical protein
MNLCVNHNVTLIFSKMEITFALKEPKKLVVLSLHGDIDLLPKFLTITHIIFVQYEVLE